VAPEGIRSFYPAVFPSRSATNPVMESRVNTDGQTHAYKCVTIEVTVKCL